MHLLVRNTVRDFNTWVKVFRDQEAVGSAAGLHVENLWQAADDPNTVWFVMRVDSRERADAFMADPQSARAGEVSGVIDGEYYYLESATS